MLGGWCWQKTAVLLRAQGHQVYTPTLTGMGERAHLLNKSINHDIYLQDILNVIHYESLQDVILAGHSYSGLIIARVANAIPEKIKRLVYLDAFVPDNYHSYLDIKSAAIREADLKNAIEQGDGWRKMPPPSSALLSWGIHNPADREAIHAKLTPIALAGLQQPVVFDEKKLQKIPTVFISCTGADTADHMQPSIERAKNRNWEIVELNTSHLPMITAPELLANLFLTFSE